MITNCAIKESALEILIVEDDASQRKTLSEIIFQEGFKVTACAMAEEALDYLRAGKIDVAIVDLRLPDLEENALLDKLSAFAADIPIVLNTGYASLRTASNAVNIGAFAYIEKRSDPSELIGHVHRAIGTRLKRRVEELESAVTARTSELIKANELLRNEITERKQAEKSLEKLAAFLENIIQQNPTSLWISDRHGMLIKANQACLDLFEVKDCKEVGLYNILRDSIIQQQGFMPLVENVFKKGEIARFEIDYNLSEIRHVEVDDSSQRILEVVVAPIKDSTGKVTNAIVQHKDITALRKAEGNLRQRESELAHIARVASMGEMVAIIAHEVNQPLHAISSYSDGACLRLKSGNADTAALVEAMEHITVEAHRASETIRRLRRLLRRHQPTRLTMSVNQAIRDAVSLIKRESLERKVQICLELAEDLPPIHADPIQIEQVILNLVRNAFDAMADIQDHEKRITILTCLRSDDSVEVAVHDTGVGYEPENEEKLFDAFFTSKSNGMGMGLAICRFLIESHSGKIWVETGKPRGAIFRFTLPVSLPGEVHA
ncbi:MAG: response regulator [Pirellulales bacterium]|nr:response regulator [Pirellulales bacterium]